MKDYRHPNCITYCSRHEVITCLAEKAEAIEVLAETKDCISSVGELNCIGPQLVTSADNPKVLVPRCRAVCETPDIINVEDPGRARFFEAWITRIMGEAFNFK